MPRAKQSIKKPTKRTSQRAREQRGGKKAGLWYARFLKAYAKTGNISLSCKAARIGRQTYYDNLAADPSFQVAVDLAKEEALDELEAIAVRRAKSSSDYLLKFLLENLRPNVFRPTIKQQHSGTVSVDVSQLSDEELRRIAQA